jgi:hypothetical protein
MPQSGSSRFRFPKRSLDFSIDITFRPHYSPGVDSVSNSNEYQESFLGVESGRCIRLTTSPPSVSQCGLLDVSHTFELPWRITGITLPYKPIDNSIGCLIMRYICCISSHAVGFRLFCPTFLCSPACRIATRLGRNVAPSSTN